MAAANSRCVASGDARYVELFLELPAHEFCQLVFEAYEHDLYATYGDRPEVFTAVEAFLAEITVSTASS